MAKRSIDTKHLKITADLIPIGDNEVATLDEELATKIFKHHASVAESNAYKALYASAMKRAHSNSQTDAMSDTFKTWYKKYKMDRAYGTPKNFQHWVKAGLAIERHRKLFGEDLIDLPLQRGISAMEELGRWSDAEIKLAMEHAWKRKTLSQTIEELRTKHGTKPKKPIINANATAASLKAWKEAWTNPQAEKSTDTHSVAFIEIKAANRLFFFDTNAEHEGKTKIVDLEKVQAALLKVLKKFEAEEHIKINSNLEHVKERFQSKAEKAKKAKAEKDSKKKTKSKSAS